jgi:hypothetical protein
MVAGSRFSVVGFVMKRTIAVELFVDGASTHKHSAAEQPIRAG